MPLPSLSTGNLQMLSTGPTEMSDSRKRALESDDEVESGSDGSVSGHPARMERDRFEKRLRAGSITQSRSHVMCFS
jgi:hypothetical protein